MPRGTRRTLHYKADADASMACGTGGGFYTVYPACVTCPTCKAAATGPQPEHAAAPASHKTVAEGTIRMTKPTSPTAKTEPTESLGLMLTRYRDAVRNTMAVKIAFDHSTTGSWDEFRATEDIEKAARDAVLNAVKNGTA